MIVSVKRVVCPFSGDGGFCDNLVSGVPVCVVSGFYLSGGYDVELRELLSGVHRDYDDICSHFVRGRFYDFVMVEENLGKCFFGGLCVRCRGQESKCSACSRWR